MKRPSPVGHVRLVLPSGHSAFRGTCFGLGDPGTAITAAHCVTDVEADQLAVMFPSARAAPTVSVKQVDRHPSADVARLQLEVPSGTSTQFYRGVTRAFHQGQTVLALGFTDDARSEAEVEYSLRYFAGNFQRSCVWSATGNPFKALEVSFPSPTGLSGGPLFNSQDHDEVIGVMCDNVESRTQRHGIEEAQRDGNIFRETIYRVVEYGIAVDLYVLTDWVLRPW